MKGYVEVKQWRATFSTTLIASGNSEMQSGDTRIQEDGKFQQRGLYDDNSGKIIIYHT
jgi:hypothetical protein